MTVGVVSLLLGPQAREKNTLEAEKLGLLLQVEKLQVGVVDHVQASAVLPGRLVAHDDLLSQLVEGILCGHFCFCTLEGRSWGRVRVGVGG